VRIHEAKRLLLTTQNSIADISCLVGYTSLGTFTTRFTECVGVSPGRFRRLAECGLLGPVEQAAHRPGTPAGSLTGIIKADDELAAEPIFIGAFNGRIPQGKPDACLAVPGVGSWFMDSVPEGDWQVMAVTLGRPPTSPHRSGAERPTLVAGAGPVRVRRDSVCNVDLILRPVRPTDPPVLVSLPALLNLPAGQDRNLKEDAAV